MSNDDKSSDCKLCSAKLPTRKVKRSSFNTKLCKTEKITEALMDPGINNTIMFTQSHCGTHLPYRDEKSP